MILTVTQLQDTAGPSRLCLRRSHPFRCVVGDAEGLHQGASEYEISSKAGSVAVVVVVVVVVVEAEEVEEEG